MKDLYLFPSPEKGKLSKDKSDHNKQTLEIAEDARYQREIQLRNSNYNVMDISKGRIRFMDYFDKLMNTKNQSLGNYGNWRSTKLHLEAYCDPDLLLSEIDKQWLIGFKEWLQNASSGDSGDKDHLIPEQIDQVNVWRKTEQISWRSF